MNISAIMSTKLITLTMDDSLADAKTLFEQHPIHHILIIDDKKALVGVLTDRDLYLHLSPTIGTAKETHQDLQMMKKKVHQIMTRDIITASSTLTVKEALLLLDDHHISCLPIIDSNKLVGIISWRDIISVLADIYRQQK